MCALQPGRITETIPRQIRGFLTNCVRIDTRTLAVFRMLLGALIVADIFLRSRNFGFFYTESGVVPQSLAERYTVDTAVSIYYFTTDPVIIAALFVLTALVGIQLLIGYRTRVASILAFFLVISLDHHNPLVLSFADTLFRMLLFWAIFLPLGERWSVDAVHRQRESRDSIASVATALILIQVVFVYLSNAVHKAFSELWRSGEAATLVLGLDNITFLFGETTRMVPRLLQAGGFIWFVMLSLSWLLFIFRGRVRALFALMFVGVHTSFALTVRIGAFPYVSISGVILFLPAQFWTDAERVLEWLGVGPARFSGPVSHLESIASRFPNPTLDDERLGRVGKVAYTGILAVIVISILLVVVVLLMNVGTITEDREEMDDRIEETLQETTGVAQIELVATSLNIDQPGWSIFAPTPRTTDRYYVFPAEMQNGTVIDVYHDRELTFERPYDELQKQFGTYRERFYMNSIRRAGSAGTAPEYLAEEICKRYSEEHGIELRQVSMYVVEEEVTWDTIDAPAERERDASVLSRHSCDGSEVEQIAWPDI